MVDIPVISIISFRTAKVGNTVDSEDSVDIRLVSRIISLASMEAMVPNSTATTAVAVAGAEDGEGVITEVIRRPVLVPLLLSPINHVP
jgi:hypothetical protein